MMRRAVHGDELKNASLCEMDSSESQLRHVFEMLDADSSGSLDREEIKRLIHYFQDNVPSEQEVADAMEFMDQDGSGNVEFDEFLW
eukprot:COSAG02_NODE_65669_length_257_cov_0.974684_1_plen_85_part_11